MNSEYSKLWDDFRASKFHQVIQKGEKLKKSKNIVGFELLKILGLSYDQFALQISNKKRKLTYQKNARMNFETIVKNYPKSESGYQGLGLVALHQGRLQASLLFYKKALKINPANMGTCISLGNVARARKNYSAALQWYKRCLSHKQTKLVVLVNIAMMYNEWKKPVLAKKYAMKALKILKNSKEESGFIGFQDKLEKIVANNTH